MHVFLVFNSFIIARGRAMFSRAAIVVAMEGSAKHVA